MVDIADYWTQPHYFGVDTVDFKIGSEMELPNHLLTLLRWTKEMLRLNQPRWLLRVSRVLIGLAVPFGTTQGALMVEVKGRQQRRSVSVYAAERGEIIPALLPSIAAQRILAGDLNENGILPLPSWMPLPRLAQELGNRNVQIAERCGDGEWRQIIQTGVSEA